jgi:hypothetical protein
MRDDLDEELLYEGAQCGRCDLDLDPRTGMCPNDRCPFHVRYQDEIVRFEPPDEDEERHIDQVRAGLLDGR